MSLGSKAAQRFLECRHFAVAGASVDQNKFGNKVLRCYMDHGRPVVPIHHKEAAIEGIPCAPSLAALPAAVLEAHTPAAVGVSIVTPPALTLKVLEDGHRLGFRHFLLQPGTVDEACRPLMAAMQDDGCNVLESCLLLELGGGGGDDNGDGGH